jgi:formate hydrogenlyase subunit 3/multisubunit Na+/H+ antiporter MnhD subunit
VGGILGLGVVASGCPGFGLTENRKCLGQKAQSNPREAEAPMTGFLQLVSVVYLIAVWTIIAFEASDPTTGGMPDALVLAGGIVLSVPALALAFFAEPIRAMLGWSSHSDMK